MTNQEEIMALQERMRTIRAVLSDPDLMIETTVGGISERIDREGLRKELKELEYELAVLTGSARRFESINLTRC